MRIITNTTRARRAVKEAGERGLVVIDAAGKHPISESDCPKIEYCEEHSIYCHDGSFRACPYQLKRER